MTYKEEPKEAKPLIIRSSKRKRTVSLSVQKDGTLRVLAPNHTSQKWIMAFIEERKNWIETRRKELQKRCHNTAAFFQDSAQIPLEGKGLTLSFKKGTGDVPYFEYKEGLGGLDLYLPSGMEDSIQQEEARTALILWYKKQARYHLPLYMKRGVSKTGLTPSRFYIREAKHQWGSCNSKNEIRLNWRLITVPPPLIEYVVVHELCHISYKNHGPSFWGLCETFLPDLKKRRKKLRDWEKNYPPDTFP